MCERFIEWEDDIKRYCKNHSLNYKKAKNLVSCWNEDMLVLQHHDPEKGEMGLLDETPAPVVLIIFREPHGLRFEQTQYTKQYLAI